MAIRFRRDTRPQTALRPPIRNANAATALPLIPARAPVARALFNLRHHIISWLILLSCLLFYLHVGHRVSYEPVAFYNPRLFWRSLAGEISTAITRVALRSHSICERFQV